MKGAAMKNTSLRAERHHKGWNQQQLADFAGLSLSTVERAERGEPMRVDSIQRLCACLQKTPEQLGLLNGYEKDQTFLVSRDTKSDDLDKRQTHQMLSVTSTAFFKGTQELFSPPLWERLSRALAKSSSIDGTVLSGLEIITKHYWQLRTKIAYRDLLSGFLGHFETITRLLQYPQPQAIHKRLCSAVGEVAQCLGATLFDMKDYATARAYYKVSIEATQEANNYTLWAVGLGRMSSLPIYSDQPQEALPLLQEAQRLAAQHSTAIIRAWLASVEAEAYANLHDERNCLQTLKQAERIVEQVKTREDAYDVRFDYARLVGYKGVCHLRLHQPEAALLALNEGVKLIDSTSTRQKSIMIADSASAYGQQGEIEKACECAIQALTMTDQTKSQLVLQRLRDFRRDIKMWENTKYVRDFDEQMTLRSILIN
jgi:transcriptional regulator with XRE-family HTH domain